MSSDGGKPEHDALIDIKFGSETIDFEEIVSAFRTLNRALLDHRNGSPEQVLAWENGMLSMPPALRDRFPPLAWLDELARKAWPAVDDPTDG